MHICDISLVEALMCLRTVVIAGGGGGIPVVRDEQGRRHGVEAVIDKDLTTAAMANVLGIRDMMILTAVPRVAIHFGKPEQQDLSRVSLSQIRRWQARGAVPGRQHGPEDRGGDPLPGRRRAARDHHQPGHRGAGAARGDRHPHRARRRPRCGEHGEQLRSADDGAHDMEQRHCGAGCAIVENDRTRQSATGHVVPVSGAPT